MLGAILVKWQVRAAYGKMNRKELARFMRGWADDAVFEFPGTSPMSGRYEGRRAIEGFFRKMSDRMATIHFTVKRIAVTRPFALGLSNTGMVEWTLDETSYDGVTIHLEGVTAGEIRRGRMVAVRDYLFDTEPLATMWGRPETAALKEPDALTLSGRP